MSVKNLFSKKGLAAKILVILDSVGRNGGYDIMFGWLLLLCILWLLCKVVPFILDYSFKCMQLESEERLKMKKMEIEKLELEQKFRDRNEKKRKKRKRK